MKRFAAFYFDQYYPGGGWNDFKGTFDTMEEAITVGNQVVDLHNGDVVYGKDDIGR